MDTQDQMPVGGFHPVPPATAPERESAHHPRTHGPLSLGDGLAILGVWLGCIGMYVIYYLYDHNATGPESKLDIVQSMFLMVVYLAPFVTAYYLSKWIITRVNPEE